MHLNADEEVHEDYFKALIASDRPMAKLDGGADPRIFPAGKVIRRCYLDELPQLINVLRGEMSLVGPRPCLPYEAAEYDRWHTGRFKALPGMTGLWQVSGKNKTTFTEMVRYDIAYAQRLSSLRDIKILLRTLPSIVAEVSDRLMERRGERRRSLNARPIRKNT
jgi:lipopolysaccharide/colanic/teichoic acid biosynthesis glycosyltransferase